MRLLPKKTLQNLLKPAFPSPFPKSLPNLHNLSTYKMPESSVAAMFGKKELWNVHAPEYSQLASRGGPTQAVTDAVVSVANGLRPFSQASGILDDGCGTGQVTQSLIADHGSEIPADARLLASDFSSGMIEQVEATKKQKSAAGEEPLWARVETHVLDAQDLAAIPDGSLTHVLSNLCLFGVPDSLKALREAHRVLVPGGAVAASGLQKTPWFDMLVDADKVRPGTNATIGLPEAWKSPEKLKALFEEAGFKDVETRIVDLKVALPPNPVDFYNRFVRMKNPGTAIFEGWSDAELSQVAELASKKVREIYGEGQITLEGAAVVAGGKK